jgi:hypothetical protein
VRAIRKIPDASEADDKKAMMSYKLRDLSLVL